MQQVSSRGWTMRGTKKTHLGTGNKIRSHAREMLQHERLQSICQRVVRMEDVEEGVAVRSRAAHDAKGVSFDGQEEAC
jgi:hypothetical protein